MERAVMVRRKNDGLYWNLVFFGITVVLLAIMAFIFFAKSQTGS